MTARALEGVAILLLLAASAACGEASDSSPSAGSGGTEDHFAVYARSLFTELRQEPIDSKTKIDIGLFDDLLLSTDERVVMRRYRYRVDSAEFGPVAQMAFQVRDSLQQDESLPVILTFAYRQDVWRLESADYGAHATGVATRGDSIAIHPQAPDSQNPNRQTPDLRSADPFDAPEAGMTPLQRVLHANFHPWIDAAVRRTNQPAET